MHSRNFGGRADERIPNRLVLLALASAAVGAVAGGWRTLIGAALGFVLAAAPLMAVLLTRGIGLGDVKMAAALGAAAGLVHPLAAVSTVFVTAMTSSVFGALTGTRRLRLGPWLWAGFIASSIAFGIV